MVTVIDLDDSGLTLRQVIQSLKHPDSTIAPLGDEEHGRTLYVSPPSGA